MDDAWAVSSDESGSSRSSCASSSSGLNAALRIIQPKRRGRPRKYARGLSRAERKRLLAESKVCELAGESFQVPVVAALSLHVDLLASYVRPLGDDMSVVVGNVIRWRVCRELGDETRKFLEHFLSEPPAASSSSSAMPVLPRLVPIGALSRILSMPRRTLQRKLTTSAAAIYFGSRALASSWISSVLQRERSGVVKVVACFKHVLYDETPLSLRSGSERDAVPNKLFQSEVQLAIVTQSVKEPHRFACSLLALPQIIQTLRRGTGPILKKALDRACGVPFWRELETQCDGVFSCEVSCADRAGANNVAEDLIYADTEDVARARFPCYAHISATSQGRGMSSCSDDITGVISTSLQMGNAGETTDFRDCIAQVLESSITAVLDAYPFPSSSEGNIYLAACLRATLPGTDQGLQRAKELSMLLTSDIRESAIVLRVPGGQLDRAVWARRVADLLLPAGIKVFPRHRWCNSLESIASYSLLGCVHNVLHRAGKLWLGATKKVSVPAPQNVVSTWAVSDDEEEDITAQMVVVANTNAAGAASEQDPTKVWTQFKQNQKAKALRFVSSRPVDRLMVILISMELSVSFLRTVEHLGSDKFQFRAWQATSTGQYTSRVLHVWQGCLERVVEDVMSRLLLPSTWACVRPGARRAGLASLSFSMVYVVRCALEQLALVTTRGLPFALWELTVRPSLQLAQQLLEEPDCMRDEFSRQFFARFNTPAKVCSAEACAFLTAMAMFVCLDICRIECRHGMLRKFINLSTTWKPLLQEISAKFVMMRSRCLEHLFSPGANAVPPARSAARRTCVVRTKVKVKGKVKLKKYTKNTGGGGAQRAFVGDWIRGKKMPTRKARKKLFKAANVAFGALQRDEEFAALQQRGIAGTVSHSAGARAFGGLQRRPLRKKKGQQVATNTFRGGGPRGGRAAQDLREQPALAIVHRTTLSDFGEVMPSAVRKEQAARAQQDIRDVVASSKVSLASCADTIWAPAAAAGGLGLQQVQHSPQIDGVNFDMECFWIMPPAKEIAARVLGAASNSKHPNDDSDAVQQKLEAAWDELHSLIVEGPEHAGQGKREMPKNKRSMHAISVCRRAGICLCGEAMAERRAFRDILGKALKSLLVKGSTGRALYDKGLLVLRVRSVRVDGSFPADSFFFVGYGNLSDLDFTVQLLTLQEAASHCDGVFMLKAADGARPQDHELIGTVVLASGNVARCDVDLWKLDLQCMEPLVHFAPVAAARATVPLVTSQVWPLPERQRAQRQTLPVRPLRALLGSQVLAPIADANPDPIRAANDGIESPDDDQRCILDIAAEELYEAAGIPAGAWSVSSDEEDGEDEGHEEERRGDVRDPVVPGGVVRPNPLAYLQHGERPGECPPPPVPDALAPCRDRRVAWPKVIASHGSGSYLRLSQTWGKQHWDCRAICREHGDVSCTKTRNMRDWRPIGRLWWWLKAGVGLSHDEHQKCPCLNCKYLKRQ